MWTLINLMNNIVVVLVCVRCLKLIPSEENIISVQQFSGCLPLFFVFSSEVLKSGGKSCFNRDVFQDAVMLYLRIVFLLYGEFPMLYCCEDCKNIIRVKNFLQSRFFCLFFRHCKFPPEIQTFFELGAVLFFNLGKFPPKI